MLFKQQNNKQSKKKQNHESKMSFKKGKFEEGIWTDKNNNQERKKERLRNKKQKLFEGTGKEEGKEKR